MTEFFLLEIYPIDKVRISGGNKLLILPLWAGIHGGLSIRALAIFKVSETLFTLIHRPHRLSAMIPKTNHVSEPKSFAALLLYLIESPTIEQPEKC